MFQELHYILLNTFLYGSVALLIASFFAYSKVLNFSLGAYLTFAVYVIWEAIQHGFSLTFWLMLIVFFVSLLLVHWLLVSLFPNEKQREQAWLVITLGLSILIENMIGWVFGPLAISVSGFSFSWWQLLLILLLGSGGLWYRYQKTLVGKLGTAITENEYLIRGMGVSVRKFSLLMWLALCGLLFLVAWVLLNESSLKAGDGFFYMIKGLGIMILAGIEKKEYLYLTALLYVIVEYLLFVQWGLPLSYKETLILIVILLVLLLRPQGLFSRKKRTL